MTNILIQIALTSGTRYYAIRDTYYIRTGSGDSILWPDDSEILWPSGLDVEWPEDAIILYKGDLVDFPGLTESLPNLFYGVEEAHSITLELADSRGDSWHDIIAAEEIRGVQVTIMDESETVLATGKISAYTADIGIRLTVELRNDEVFDSLLPSGVVTAAEFTETAIDVGAPIPIIFGYAKNVPLANIQNNTDDDYYDYLIGYGPVESLHVDHAHGYGVKRDGVLVNTGDYTFYDGSQVSPYNGYAFVRFTVEQKDFNGRHHNIHADVYGLELGGASADRNFSNCIKAFLNNSTWGLGESVNADSFTTAATTLGDWKCDGAIYEQGAARDILDELLFAARSRLYRNSSGEWVISVDGTASSSATFGDYEGYYNNCSIESVSAQPSSSAIRTAKVRYDDDRYEITLDVHTGFGVEKIYSVPFVADLATAEKVLSYIYGRAYYADKQLSMLADSDAAGLSPGDVITVTSSRHGLSAASYRVTSITRSLDHYRLECEAYNAAIFDAQDIDDPTESATVYEAHDLQTIDSGYVGGMVITGTAITTADGLVGLSSAVTGGTDWRIWAGHATPGSAPFRVDENGAMWATNATITGTITATLGAIGGFTIAATTLTGTNLILDSGNQKITLGTGTDICILDAGDATYRLAIGHSTYASAPFSVTKAGLMKCASGNLGSWTIDSDSIYVGTKASLDSYSALGITVHSRGSINAKYFYISQGGYLYCQAAHIAGSIDSGSTLTVAQGGDIVLVGGASGNPSLLRIRDGSAVQSEVRFEDYTAATTKYWSIMKCCGSSGLEIGPTAALSNPYLWLGNEGNTNNRAHTIYITGTSAIYIGNYGATAPATIQVEGYYGSLVITSAQSSLYRSSDGSSYNAVIYATSSTTKLNVNGTEYIEMGSSAITVKYNATFQGNVYLGDSDYLCLGASGSSDMCMYFNGSRGYLLVPGGASSTSPTLTIGYSSSYPYLTGYYYGGHHYGALCYDGDYKFVVHSTIQCYENIVPSVANSYECGTQSLYWSNVSSKVFEDIADWPHLDSIKDGSKIITIDDVAVIKGIVGSGIYDETTGMELIDDNSLPAWLLSKHTKNQTYTYYDMETGEEGVQMVKKGETKLTPDGKPFLNLHTMISLCMGAIRQLDGKIEGLKGER